MARKRLPYRKLETGLNTGILRAVREGGFLKSGVESRLGQGPILCRGFDRRLAILVHQGEDPKLPYQALMVRQSAKL